MATVIVTINAEPTDPVAFMEDLELGINRIVGSLGFTANNVTAEVMEADFPGADSYTIAVQRHRAVEEDWED